jgi:dihydroorotate dehydrogenase (NAD+) catalytic subunit
MQKVDLTTELAGVRLRNPVLTSSGTYGFGEEYEPYCRPSLLGGITVKGITPLPRLGKTRFKAGRDPFGTS